MQALKEKEGALAADAALKKDAAYINLEKQVDQARRELQVHRITLSRRLYSLNLKQRQIKELEVRIAECRADIEKGAKHLQTQEDRLRQLRAAATTKYTPVESVT